MRLLLPLVALSLLLGTSCATTKKKKAKRPKPPEATASETPSTQELDKDILAQTTETAAKELGCPKEQLIARCTQHDAQGSCIAINVRGCDKTLDYQFGAN